MNNDNRFNHILTPSLQQIVDIFELAGLAVGILQDDELVYGAGFGVRNIDTAVPLTPDTVFYTASISKTVVATAIMTLVEANKVALEEPITNYLPYFKLTDERDKTITIQHLLSHTSGMPDVEDYHWHQPTFADGALEQYVRRLQDQSLLFAPGEAFAYSNMAYEVLGDVIAKTSDQPFETYIAEAVLKPLEMTSSTFVRQKVPSNLAISPHVRLPDLRVSPIYPDNREHAPSSTFHSSLIDLSKFAKMYLNQGFFQRKQFLSQSSIDLLWHPFHFVDDDEEEYIGLSWFIEPYDNDQKRFIYHEGGDIGFLANLALLPEENLAVIVLANSALAPIWEITDIVLATVRGHDFDIPKPPALIALTQTYVEKGLIATLEQANYLKQNQLDQYNFDINYFYFPAFHCLTVLQQPEIAIDILQICKVVHPESDQIHQHLAWAFLKQGDRAQALDFAKEAIDLNPENEDVARLITEIQNDQGSRCSFGFR